MERWYVHSVWGVASTLGFVVLLAVASPAFSQAALAAAGVDPARLPPESRLTLRPEAGLELLAGKIARVLLLRGDTNVEVGASPPPGLLEAVPAGHIALARGDSGVRLVMGAALGESFEAQVQVDADGEMDPRSLALAVEALRDRAIEAREHREVPSSEPPLPAANPYKETEYDETEPSVAHAGVPVVPVVVDSRRAGLPAQPTRDEGVSAPWPEPVVEDAMRIQPRLYLRIYGGASPASKALRSGVGTGGGLCLLGQCVLLAVEYPLPVALEPGGDDVRYRYPTFSCSFYSHPVQVGRFTPAVGVGLLSRIGHFERDMGIVDYRHGLETDLAVRGNVEGAYEIVDSIDLVAEAGLDFALDRVQLGHGNSVAYRGPRMAPWLQAGIRVRPY
jgi:hypothetical protein